ncbi:TetR/AcrR family transcriptional regulator [Haematomicrobium sanguinis]|uniref:TetR/AcrR family transcriptional regulator n=1 Tax=Haematomicrobium sanguinis TaxID=479106 RepID=UPI0004786A74|nr:TetR family transcriptional regulator [Haematomicrobium sanguinis]
MARKGEQTRSTLIDVALERFKTQGYEATTMRQIAADAGVSTGNAYHYFGSKDELVQQLYIRVQAEHSALAMDRLKGLEGKPLSDQLRAVLHAGFDVMAPYHQFGSTFAAVALNPDSASNPLSEQSAEPRRRSISIFERAVNQSSVKVPQAIRDELPETLWLSYLGLTLFWVYDKSPDQRRTHQLIDAATPLIGKILNLTRIPIAGNLLKDIVKLVAKVRTGADLS